MMAILPPTSPTTVIGGFSLAIITAKESRSGYLCTPLNDGQRCLIPKQIGKVDWVKWVERVFFFFSSGELQRSNSYCAQKVQMFQKQLKKSAAVTTIPIVPHLPPTGLNQRDKLSTAHAMHKDTGFLPSIPNQKVKSCCLDSQPQPQPQPQAQAQAGPQQQSADQPICIRESTFTQDHSCWQALMKASSHILADVLGGQSSVQQHCWYYFYMHATAGTHLAHLSARSNSCILSMLQNTFCFFPPNLGSFLWALKGLSLKRSQQQDTIDTVCKSWRQKASVTVHDVLVLGSAATE